MSRENLSNRQARIMHLVGQTSMLYLVPSWIYCVENRFFEELDFLSR